MIDKISREALLGGAPVPIIAIGALVAVFGVQALTAAVAVAAFAAGVFVLNRMAITRKEKRTDAENLAATLDQIHHDVTGKMPFHSALKKAISNKRHGKLKQLLERIGKRLELGQNLADSIKSERAEDIEINKTLEGVSNSTAGFTSSLKGGYYKLVRKNQIQRSKDIAATQRYLVLGVVSNTILPSLATFAFVGYTIINNSYSAFLLFSVVLLSALPSFSAIIKVKINEL